MAACALFAQTGDLINSLVRKSCEYAKGSPFWRAVAKNATVDEGLNG
jgi:hypothetical protein